MSDSRDPDWDPRAPRVRRDQIAAYDDMRRDCPVAHSELLGWSLFRHEDVLAVANDHETFSSVVSTHSSVPNGMDPPEHTEYRRAIEPFFEAPRMDAFEPVCRGIAAQLSEPLIGQPEFDLMDAFAVPFAVRCQCAFLGWPEALARPLRAWTVNNRLAGLDGDRQALSNLAREFGDYVDQLLSSSHELPPGCATLGLMEVRVRGQKLSREELISILRNWTVGEVGSLADSVGIVAHHLAQDTALQQQVRTQRALLPAVIEETLRVRGPLLYNRRVAKRDVQIGARRIGAGERVALMWSAANRDERAFERPEQVDPTRDARHNLLFGAGIHLCPGAPLARLELRVALWQLIEASTLLELTRPEALEAASYPANGWVHLPMRLT